MAPVPWREQPSRGLAVIVRRQGERALINVRGDLDIATAPALAEQLTALVGQAADIEIDLTEVDFIDCRGFSVLLDAARRQRRGGTLTLRSPSAIAQRAIHLLGLEEFLPVCDGGEQPTSSEPGDDRTGGVGG
jgi:anti-sigma B factor antagonist